MAPSKVPHARLPGLVAHRGYARRYPENTLAAVRGALEVGARYVEIDVQLTADRTPVLFHDRTLERLCGVPGAIHERTDAELAHLFASEPERFGERFRDEPVATLAGFVELISAAPGVEAFVELKRAAVERFGARELVERTLEAIRPLAGRCVLISFSIETLALARTLTDLPLGPVIEAWADLERDDVRALGADVVFADERILPAEGELSAGSRGTRLAVYEVDDVERALALAARGVELVETFAVGELLAAFHELEAAP